MSEIWLNDCIAIVGRDAVIADEASLLTYENDAFTLVRAAPQAVILPRDTQQTAAVARVLAKHNLPIVPRGAGTSLAGGTVAVGGGVCVCTARMRDILDINLRERWARVQAGVPNLLLTRQLAGSGYQFAPDPSSQAVSTIGGNVATNAGGPHTLKLGVTTNHVLAVTMVLADGEVVRLGETELSAQCLVPSAQAGGVPGSQFPDRDSELNTPPHPSGHSALGTRHFAPPCAFVEDSSGYDLRALAVGSEGTLGIITEAVVRLTRLPESVRTLLAVFNSIDEAAATISDIIAAGIVPAALEMIDRLTLECVEAAFAFGFPADAGAVLIIELDGIAAGLGEQAQRVTTICHRHNCRELREAESEKRRAELWKCRKKAFGAYGRFGKACCTQDGVVPRTKVPQIIRFIADVSARYGLAIPTMMHAGDGNIHPVLMYDEGDATQIRAVLDASKEILLECVRLGGSVTGEHGIGIEKTEHLRAMFSETDLAVQMKVREAFDPGRRCNPHKLIAAGAACLEQMKPSRGISP